MEQRLIDADRFRGILLDFSERVEKRWTNLKTARITNIIDSIITVLDKSPIIDPESLRPKANWLYCQGTIKCSNCNIVYYSDFGRKFKYCPHCGAKMAEDKSDETSG